jgi:hypothetical protein
LQWRVRVRVRLGSSLGSGSGSGLGSGLGSRVARLRSSYSLRPLAAHLHRAPLHSAALMPRRPPAARPPTRSCWRRPLWLPRTVRLWAACRRATPPRKRTSAVCATAPTCCRCSALGCSHVMDVGSPRVCRIASPRGDGVPAPSLISLSHYRTAPLHLQHPLAASDAPHPCSTTRLWRWSTLWPSSPTPCRSAAGCGAWRRRRRRTGCCCRPHCWSWPLRQVWPCGRVSRGGLEPREVPARAALVLGVVPEVPALDLHHNIPQTFPLFAVCPISRAGTGNRYLYKTTGIAFCSMYVVF